MQVRLPIVIGRLPETLLAVMPSVLRNGNMVSSETIVPLNGLSMSTNLNKDLYFDILPGRLPDIEFEFSRIEAISHWGGSLLELSRGPFNVPEIRFPASHKVLSE